MWAEEVLYKFYLAHCNKVFVVVVVFLFVLSEVLVVKSGWLSAEELVKNLLLKLSVKGSSQLG